MDRRYVVAAAVLAAERYNRVPLTQKALLEFSSQVQNMLPEGIYVKKVIYRNSEIEAVCSTEKPDHIEVEMT